VPRISAREAAAASGSCQDAEALPLVELDLSKLPEGVPRIAGTEVKWERDTDVYRETKAQVAKDLDAETETLAQARYA
jgi:D-alanine-D-alanine ligase